MCFLIDKKYHIVDNLIITSSFRSNIMGVGDFHGQQRVQLFSKEIEQDTKTNGPAARNFP
jgi:hypothetical protein